MTAIADQSCRKYFFTFIVIIIVIIITIRLHFLPINECIIIDACDAGSERRKAISCRR